jgi:hypothetical protein
MPAASQTSVNAATVRSSDTIISPGSNTRPTLTPLQPLRKYTVSALSTAISDASTTDPKTSGDGITSLDNWAIPPRLMGLNANTFDVFPLDADDSNDAVECPLVENKQKKQKL